MITKPSQLHTINSRHISSCIPSSKREKKIMIPKPPVFSKSEAGEAPSTLSSLRAQDFTFCSLWPAFSKFAQVTLTGFTIESKCRQSAWSSNRLVFFETTGENVPKNYQFLKKKSIFHFINFQEMPVSWVESILTDHFFLEPKTQPLDHSTISVAQVTPVEYCPAFLGSQPQLHSAKVGVSAAWPPSSGVVWYYDERWILMSSSNTKLWK